LRNIIATYQEHGSFTEARVYIDELIRVSREIGDLSGEATAMTNLGGLYLDHDRLLDSYKAFRAAEEIVAGSPEAKLRTSIMNNLGIVCRDLGRFDQALTYLHAAAELKRPQRRLLDQDALTLWNIGAVLHLRGEHRAARPLFEQVFRVSVQSGFHRGEALALTGLCSVGRTLGESAATLDLGRRALELARQWGLRKVECEALAVLGEATCALGEFESAWQIYERAREYSRTYGFRRYTARSFEGFAHIEWQNGRLGEARTWWKQAVDLHPDEIIEAAYARRHLAALDDPTITCFRCALLSTG
jgi:tetratricopeptide (TPR) repeat protein